jgi:hypothetical protein
VPGLGRDFLEGVRIDNAPALAAWLESERRRYAALSEAILREECLSLLAQGAASQAARLGARLVELNPLDEAHHTLLIRSLATAGDGIAAARQVASCRELFRRELGIEPSPALQAAASTSTARAVAPAITGPAAVCAQIEAGEAAVRAPWRCTRLWPSRSRAGSRSLQTCAASSATRIPAGPVRTRNGLGGACKPLRTRGSPQCCAIQTLQGSVYSDTAHYALALDALDSAAECARQLGDNHQQAYALSMIGRTRLLRGELDLAAPPWTRPSRCPDRAGPPSSRGRSRCGRKSTCSVATPLRPRTPSTPPSRLAASEGSAASAALLGGEIDNPALQSQAVQ